MIGSEGAKILVILSAFVTVSELFRHYVDCR